MHKVVYESNNIVSFARPVPRRVTYQELLKQKNVDEKVIVIFDLSGQRGYMLISSMEDYNWYINHTRGDGRFSEDFFWIVNKRHLN